VRLVNALTTGLMYIVSKDKSLASLASLKGRSILVPYPNDTPDLLFRSLLKAAKMDAESDVKIMSTGTPIEALQLFLADRADAAVLPEPGATAAILRAKAAGQTVERVIDFQKAWGEVTGKGPSLPLAGLAITDAFFREHAEALDLLHEGLRKATEAVIRNPARAASNSAAELIMPWPVLEQSIHFSNFACIRARDARADLETMFGALAGMDPTVIGGKLPDDALYL
jgi:NitT/TauT family transport system substrate-binding protein